MLKTYIRDELSSLSRQGILSAEEQAQALGWARDASFVTEVAEGETPPRPRRTPATRRQAERQGAYSSAVYRSASASSSVAWPSTPPMARVESVPQATARASVSASDRPASSPWM